MASNVFTIEEFNKAVDYIKNYTPPPIRVAFVPEYFLKNFTHEQILEQASYFGFHEVKYYGPIKYIPTKEERNKSGKLRKNNRKLRM